MPKTGVLVVGYGGPDSLDSVGPFMLNLTGREPSAEVLERVKRRYLAIGGSSPLTEIAAAIAGKLASFLGDTGYDVPIEIGMRYWMPFIEEGVDRLLEQGCTRIVAVSLSPFESNIAGKAYRSAVGKALEGKDVELVWFPLLSELPELADFFAGSTAVTIQDTECDAKGWYLLFTAHSLPIGDLVEDDPYVRGLKTLADSVATRLGLDAGFENAGESLFEEFRAYGNDGGDRPWFLAYQSQGERPVPWLGPTLEEFVTAARAAHAPGIVVCPIGFFTDHMETLYDLDIVAADLVLSHDMEFARVAVPNNYDTTAEAIALRLVGMLS